MRPQFLLLAVFAFAPVGCGTFQNLAADPGPPPEWARGAGPTGCIPFGGVQRSMRTAALMFNPVYAAAGVVYLGVDGPLSLAGDVVTLPYVYARTTGANRAEKAEDAKRELVDPPEEVSGTGVKWGQTKRNFQGPDRIVGIIPAGMPGETLGISGVESVPAGPNGGIIDRPMLQANDPNRNR